MIHLTENCDKQPVTLEYLDGDGNWTCAALNDDDESPHIFDCDHAAFSCLLDLVRAMFTEIAMGRIPLKDAPTLERFRFSRLEDQPVTNLDQALAVINKIRSGV